MMEPILQKQGEGPVDRSGADKGPHCKNSYKLHAVQMICYSMRINWFDLAAGIKSNGSTRPVTSAFVNVREKMMNNPFLVHEIELALDEFGNILQAGFREDRLMSPEMFLLSVVEKLHEESGETLNDWLCYHVTETTVCAKCASTEDKEYSASIFRLNVFSQTERIVRFISVDRKESVAVIQTMDGCTYGELLHSICTQKPRTIKRADFSNLVMCLMNSEMTDFIKVFEPNSADFGCIMPVTDIVILYEILNSHVPVRVLIKGNKGVALQSPTILGLASNSSVDAVVNQAGLALDSNLGEPHHVSWAHAERNGGIDGSSSGYLKHYRRWSNVSNGDKIHLAYGDTFVIEFPVDRSSVWPASAIHSLQSLVDSRIKRVGFCNGYTCTNAMADKEMNIKRHSSNLLITLSRAPSLSDQKLHDHIPLSINNEILFGGVAYELRGVIRQGMFKCGSHLCMVKIGKGTWISVSSSAVGQVGDPTVALDLDASLLVYNRQI